MSEYFPELKSLGGRVKVATKTDLRNATDVDISKFAKKVDLANLRSNVDKSDIDKLKNVSTNLSNLKSKVDKLDVFKLVPVPFDLSKLNDIVKNDFVKKNVYNAKMKNIEDKIPITNLATKTTLNAKINAVKGEIPNITNLATNASFNAKINEVKGEIPNITNLATTSALTAAENKIPSVSNLVKKKLTIAQKLVKLKRKLLIIIMINILLLQNLIKL